MKKFAAKLSVVAVSLFAAVATAVVVAVAIDVGGSKLSGTAEVAAHLTLDVRVPPGGARLENIRYTISGRTRRDGSIAISDGPNLIAEITGLRIGGGYGVRVTATRVGASPCTASAPFEVISEATTRVSLKLSCPGLESGGTPDQMRVGPAANHCPSVQSAIATPSGDGKSVELTGAGTDPDRGPAPLSYRWTTTAGSLTSTSGAAVTLDCKAPGSYRAKFEVYDGDCRDSLEQTITCGVATTGNAASVAAAHSDSSEAARERERATDRPTSGAYVVGSANGPRQPASFLNTGNAIPSGSETTPGVAKASGTNSPSASTSPAKAGTPTGAAPGTPKTDSCSLCEAQAHDGNTNCPDSKAMCDNLVGLTKPDSPLMPGVPKAELCHQIVDCIHMSRCASPNASGQPTPSDCFCGSNVDPDTCFNHGTYGDAAGTCRTLIAAGSESIAISEIAERFFNPLYPAGAAEAVVETCDAFFCAKECL